MSTSSTHIVTCFLFQNDAPDTNIQLEIPVMDKLCDNNSLKTHIRAQLCNIYPGIDMIDLLVPKDDFENILKFNNKEVPSKLPDIVSLNIGFKLKISKDIVEQLSTIYFKITSFFGLTNFSEIENVGCNYATPKDSSGYKYILIPDIPIPVNAFKEALITFFSLFESVSIDFEKSVNNNNEYMKNKKVDYINKEILEQYRLILKEIIITFI